MRHVKPLRRAPAGTVRVDKVLASREVPVDPGLDSFCRKPPASAEDLCEYTFKGYGKLVPAHSCANKLR